MPPVARPLVYAHRGASASLPENTMAAFLAAVDLGVDGIEFDVHQTSDGHLVVIHDYDLSRTTDGEGLVHERDAAYIRSLSAGAWRGEQFRGDRVPLLEEVLALEGIAFELEVKGLPTESLVAGIAAAVQAAGVADRVKFTGWHLPVLTKLRASVPEARLGLFVPAWQPWMTDHLYQQIVTAHALLGEFDVVHCPTPWLPKLDAGLLRESGMQLLTNPLNDEEVRTALQSDVDLICTDDPARVL
jgi:glycerophosphoryl diester phosphodiesterase